KVPAAGGGGERPMAIHGAGGDGSHGRPARRVGRAGRGGVPVVLPVLLALGLTADQANATSRFNLTVGAIIATVILVRKKKVDWKTTIPLMAAAAIGALLGASLGATIHSSAMLAIIVGTSVVSMMLVYMRPNHWLSTASGGQLTPPWARVLVHFPLYFISLSAPFPTPR